MSDKGRDEEAREQQGRHCQQRLMLAWRRLDQAHQDKLGSKISEEFWGRKSSEWQVEEQQILAS
ncbi:MAG: hypothetical protein WBF56_00490, partial [Candidatus Acidiferrales bacterium]